MPSPRDVLLLCGDPGVPLYGPSGASAHLRGVAHALIGAGHRVRIAVPRRHDDRGTVDDLVGCVVTTLDPDSTRLRLRLPGTHRETALGRVLVAKAIDDGGHPDLIWERHSLWCDAGARLAAQHGIERLSELNAPLALERGRDGGVRDAEKALAFERANLCSASRVLAVSRWLADWAVDLGCAPERVRHVPNGSDLRPLPASHDGRTLGFVGSLKPWHGLQHLPALLDALPGWTVRIAGSGPTPIPHHPRIHPVGRVEPDQLAGFLAGITVAIAPYGANAPPWFCPLKVVDALAAGVPVVASDIGDCRALLARGGGEAVQPLPDGLASWTAAIRRQAGAKRVPRPRPWEAVVAEALARS